MKVPDNNYVTPDQLTIGLYVRLGLKWFEHPFSFNHFKIRDEEQIKLIKGLGLKKIRYDPARSDVKPLLGQPEKTAERDRLRSDSLALAEPKVEHVAVAVKIILIKKVQQQREAVIRIGAAFVDTAKTIHSIEKNLLANPGEAVAQAGKMVDQIADSILSAPELAIHVMGDRLGGEALYFHSLNVTLLSLMMARDINMPPEAIRSLGMGALFHDVGRRKLPNTILMKREPLTQAEKNYYELHCQYGVEIGKELNFPPITLAVIQAHHESYDGTGYPQKLQGEAINLQARIVGIANYYDELCNPLNVANALTPHEALATMFAKLRGKFDPKLLQIFVRCLGVYPPGTIVQLSNGVIGAVTTVNTARPTRPIILTYDADLPKEEAILIDMDDQDDCNIAKAIRPAQLPRELSSYFNPRKRVSYYFDASTPNKDVATP